MLRTCFRIGEAVNAGCQALRQSRDVILELYARITASWREPVSGGKQHFVIRDLYHNKPPQLRGSYSFWSQNQLWELDSNVFLDSSARADGVRARLMGRLKRDDSGLRFEVLNIWEASWDDIEHVASIYGHS